MKHKTNLICLSVATCLLCSNITMAKKPMGGFKETKNPEIENFEIITIEKAKNSKDDTFVVLQGYIDKSLGGEKYLFRDETGTIKIDIDDKHFRGLVIYPDDFVQISGKVDKNWWKETEIDVKNISKQPAPETPPTNTK